MSNHRIGFFLSKGLLMTVLISVASKNIGEYLFVLVTREILVSKGALNFGSIDSKSLIGGPKNQLNRSITNSMNLRFFLQQIAKAKRNDTKSFKF